MIKCKAMNDILADVKEREKEIEKEVKKFEKEFVASKDAYRIAGFVDHMANHVEELGSELHALTKGLNLVEKALKNLPQSVLDRIEL